MSALLLSLRAKRARRLSSGHRDGWQLCIEIRAQVIAVTGAQGFLEALDRLAWNGAAAKQAGHEVGEVYLLGFRVVRHGVDGEVRPMGRMALEGVLDQGAIERNVVLGTFAAILCFAVVPCLLLLFGQSIANEELAFPVQDCLGRTVFGPGANEVQGDDGVRTAFGESLVEFGAGGILAFEDTNEALQPHFMVGNIPGVALLFFGPGAFQVGVDGIGNNEIAGHDEVWLLKGEAW